MPPVDDADVQPMLRRLARRGPDEREVWRDADGRATVAAARHSWELVAEFGRSALVARDRDCVVVADASLYYQNDLRRALTSAGASPLGPTPAHLILAAYRAWGVRCAAHLEGDFAFVVWDAVRRRAHGARDFVGKRGLAYAELPDRLIVASAPSIILAHPQCPAKLDLPSIAASAAGLFAVGSETAYRAISTLEPGWSFTWEAAPSGARRPAARLERFWSPPTFADRASSRGLPSMDDAAEELRELLGRAVTERMATDSATSVWLSGGWDSPALFAAGKARLARDPTAGANARLLPVSMSYPPGDPGREDELIADIAGHWGSPIRWAEIGRVPLFADAERRAAEREDPLAHTFEMFNRELARHSRAVGARVALDGNGGDQFFSGTAIYLADLLRTGRWAELRHEWRAKRGKGFRNFFRWVVQPSLPGMALRAAAALRGGRPLRGYLERQLPDWIDPLFARRHRLLERERAAMPKRGGLSHAAYEPFWFLTYPIFPRLYATIFSAVLEEGVELRSPLFDQRVVAFASRRPRWERASELETKRLLRHSVRGLLPDHILAPRPSKTGLMSGYFDREVRSAYHGRFASLFEDPLLSTLGIIDVKRYRSAWDRHLRREEELGAGLYFTLETELWLRGHHP